MKVNKNKVFPSLHIKDFTSYIMKEVIYSIEVSDDYDSQCTY